MKTSFNVFKAKKMSYNFQMQIDFDFVQVGVEATSNFSPFSTQKKFLRFFSVCTPKTAQCAFRKKLDFPTTM
jgi:hypothetical protein